MTILTFDSDILIPSDIHALGELIFLPDPLRRPYGYPPFLFCEVLFLFLHPVTVNKIELTMELEKEPDDTYWTTMLADVGPTNIDKFKEYLTTFFDRFQPYKYDTISAKQLYDESMEWIKTRKIKWAWVRSLQWHHPKWSGSGEGHGTVFSAEGTCGLPAPGFVIRIEGKSQYLRRFYGSVDVDLCGEMTSTGEIINITPLEPIIEGAPRIEKISSWKWKIFNRPGRKYTVKERITNKGLCPIMARIYERQRWLGRGEVWTLPPIEQTIPIEPRRNTRIVRPDRTFVRYNPETNKVFPDVAWQKAKDRAEHLEETPIRFLRVTDKYLLIQGDHPAGETINYSGVLVAKKYAIRTQKYRPQIEEKTVNVNLPTLLPLTRNILAIPKKGLRISGKLEPMATHRIEFEKLYYLNLEFDKDITVVEGNSVRYDSTTKYTLYTLPRLNLLGLRDRLIP